MRRCRCATTAPTCVAIACGSRSSPDERTRWRPLLDATRFYDPVKRQVINLPENYLGVAARIAAMAGRSSSSRIARCSIRCSTAPPAVHARRALRRRRAADRQVRPLLERVRALRLGRGADCRPQGSARRAASLAEGADAPLVGSASAPTATAIHGAAASASSAIWTRSRSPASSLRSRNSGRRRSIRLASRVLQRLAMAAARLQGRRVICSRSSTSGAATTATSTASASGSRRRDSSESLRTRMRLMSAASSDAGIDRFPSAPTLAPVARFESISAVGIVRRACGSCGTGATAVCAAVHDRHASGRRRLPARRRTACPGSPRRSSRSCLRSCRSSSWPMGGPSSPPMAPIASTPPRTGEA